MNSKSFLFAAVFAVLSFFAICFVWEMHSALPKGGGEKIRVGSCDGYSKVYTYVGCERSVYYAHQAFGEIIVDGQIQYLYTGCQFNTTPSRVCYMETGYTTGHGDGPYLLGLRSCSNVYTPVNYSEVTRERLIGNQIFYEKECVPTNGTQTNCGTKDEITSC